MGLKCSILLPNCSPFYFKHMAVLCHQIPARSEMEITAQITRPGVMVANLIGASCVVLIKVFKGALTCITKIGAILVSMENLEVRRNQLS